MTGLPLVSVGDLSLQVSLLLDDNPDAVVAAIAPKGLVVPVPPEVPLGGHEVLTGRAAVELVAPASRAAVLTMWERVKAGGGPGFVTAHLRNGRTATAHLFDATLEWGVFILVVVPTDVPDDQGPVRAFEPPTGARPRLGRVRKSETSVVTEVDDAAVEMLGWDRADLVGRRTLELVHPDDQQRGIECWIEMLGTPGLAHRFRGRHLRGDGTWMWVDVVNHNLLHDPDHRDVLTEIIDASDEMAAHAALAAREELLNRLTEALPFGVAQLDADGGLAYANDRWRSMLGLEDDGCDRFGAIERCDRDRLDGAVADALAGVADSGLEVQVQPIGDADERLCQVEVRSLSAEGSPGVLLCVTDVTESTRLRHELEIRATVDELTSCLNRPSILDVAAWAVARRDVPDAATAVLFVDVDHFKAINDEHGHAAGDAVLREVARRFRGALRAGDQVGRLGGDEFLAVCPELLRPELALQLAHRAAEAIAGDLRHGDVVIPLRASIGVAWASNDDVDADVLIALADAAMYESKRERAGRAVLRTPPTRR